MKILQINECCTGSTGRTTVELAQFLTKEGHNCYIAYGHGSSSYEKSFRIGSRLENLIHSVFFTRILGLHGHGSILGTKRLIRWIDINKPDIIHLRSLHTNYINYPILFSYLVKSQIPIVMTLHDCFNFTGKCSNYTNEKCYKWQKGCNHCQFMKGSIGESWIFDNTDRLFEEKKRWYRQLNRMTVVGVSKWMAGEARKSMLAQNGHKITCIYNWIDDQKFHRPEEHFIESIRQKYDFQKDEKYLVSVSGSWNSMSPRYTDAIKLSKILPSNLKLVLVGATAKGSTIPNEIKHIPFIGDVKELSAVYSIADAYIHLSVADSFGKVIAEAMSCGAIPIAYDSTACGEIGGGFGIVVKPHDINAIVASLPKLELLKQQREQMVQYVHENYDYQTNAHKYIELYQELLDNK